MGARMGKEGRRVVETMFCNEHNLILLRDLFSGVQRGKAVAQDRVAQEEYLHAN